MNLNPSEISDLIKSRIQNMQLAATARNEGTVVLYETAQRSMVDLRNQTFPECCV